MLFFLIFVNKELNLQHSETKKAINFKLTQIINPQKRRL